MTEKLPRGVGPYTIVESVDNGGMGEVYEGYRTQRDWDSGKVAVKLIRVPKRTESTATQRRIREEFEARFEREARIAFALDHPNVVRVYDVGEDEGCPYIVMEYLRGITLQKLLYGIQGKVITPESMVAYIGCEVASALAYAHRRRAGCILHRDVTPANIMLTRLGEVKLLDFGAAKIQGDQALTQKGGAIGKMTYFAPEVLNGAPATAASDVFSLGVSLVELATQQRVFRKGDVLGAKYERQLVQLDGRIELTRLSSPLKHLLRRMVALDPLDRFEDGKDVYHAFLDFLPDGVHALEVMGHVERILAAEKEPAEGEGDSSLSTVRAEGSFGERSASEQEWMPSSFPTRITRGDTGGEDTVTVSSAELVGDSRGTEPPPAP